MTYKKTTTQKPFLILDLKTRQNKYACRENVTFLLRAITKTALRCLWQFINVKVPTVPDLDVNAPMTAFARPMETNLPCHSALFHWRVPTFQPAGCMRATVVFRYTRRGHCRPSIPHETVPFVNCPEVPLITAHRVAVEEIPRTSLVADYLVGFAFLWKESCKSKHA